MTPVDRDTLDRYIHLLRQVTANAPPAQPPRESRGVYEPLMAYHAARVGSDAPLAGLIDEFIEARLPEGDLPAADGARIARLAWCALTAFAAGQHRDRADAFLLDLIWRQQPTGEFLLATASDNPEPHWYHELILLHAVATFASMTDASPATQAVARAAEFHLRETQPDHATTEPWAVHAFAGHIDTIPLADALLHAAMAQHGGSVSYVAWMLLADALYCLEQSLKVNRP